MMRFFAFLAVLILAGVSQAGGHVSRSLAVYSAPAVQADVCVHDDVVPGVNAQLRTFRYESSRQRSANLYADQLAAQRAAARHAAFARAEAAHRAAQRAAFARAAAARAAYDYGSSASFRSDVIIQREVVVPRPQRIDVIERGGLFGLGLLPGTRRTTTTIIR